MDKTKGMLHLLKAPSPKVVDQIFNEIYKNRSGKVSPIILESLVSALKLTEDQALELVKSVKELVKIALYENSSNLDQLFPSSFHSDLKGLILKIVVARLPQWRQDSINNQCSLPRLKETDWRIDVKLASEAISNMSVPVVLLQLKIEKPAEQVGSTPEINNVHLELNKQTLETMLDGLGKIKSQLASLT